MTASTRSFDYPSSLEAYAIPAREFLRQHPEYHVLATGAVVFSQEGKLLLVQRAADERAFPNYWEIPGGKVDDTDETILHAAVRELQEEAGLEATGVVRKVTQLTFSDEVPGRPSTTWLKLVFEMEVTQADVVLDPIEHQQFLFAAEDEVVKDRVGDVKLAYISPENKVVKLEAFKLRQES